MKRAAVAATLLMLTSCEGNSKQIIEDVCKPINEDKNASFDKLVAAKGYDVDEARTVCHQYVVDQREEAAKMLRGLGVGKSGPYDAN